VSRQYGQFYGARTVKRRRTQLDLAIVDQAIIEAVEADSPVTLRGVFYRAVSAGAVEKTENGYRLVGRQLLKLRRAGRVSYADITDGTRWITKPETWSNLDQMLADAAASYRRALWHDQATEVQIFTEKDAISGVVLPVTEQWDVPLGVLRGYSSESFAWSVARSIIAAALRGKRDVRIYQLGDHDPSGVDAWRAFRKTVSGFLMEEHRALLERLAAAGYGTPDDDLDDEDEDEEGVSSCTFTAGQDYATAAFKRLAVTEDQIYDLSLPTRPTKQTDTRARSFEGGSVEVDAIPAPMLRQIVEGAIRQHIDAEALRLTEAAEASEREVLTRMAGGET
jgi:hypothetical protein